MAPTSLAPQNPPAFAPSELAAFLNSLADAAQQRRQPQLRQGAQHFAALAVAPPVVYATPGQREEIERLCKHPLLPRPVKTKILVGILRLTKEEAGDVIRHLQSTCSALDDMRAAV